MNFELNGLLTPSSLMFIDEDGMPHNVVSSHANFEQIKKLFKKASVEINDATKRAVVRSMVELTNVVTAITRQSKGLVKVLDGIVYYKEAPIHNTITNRILSGLAEGFDMKPYLLFLENLMQNPSRIAVNELYDFMEYGQMGISEDGFILGYKKVRNNYKDCHSGRFDNSPGQSHTMERNAVDDDRERTCSSGFHFCSFEYLKSFGGDRVVLVKVNPKDVVSIPADYNNTKARCCAYTVLKELEGLASDVLRTRSVWNDDLSDRPYDADTDEEDDVVENDDNDDNFDYYELDSYDSGSYYNHGGR